MVWYNANALGEDIMNNFIEIIDIDKKVNNYQKLYQEIKDSNQHNFLRAYLFYLNTTKKIPVVNCDIDTINNKLTIYLANFSTEIINRIVQDKAVFYKAYQKIITEKSLKIFDLEIKPEIHLKNKMKIDYQMNMAKILEKIQKLDQFPEIKKLVLKDKLMIVVQDNTYTELRYNKDYCESIRKFFFQKLLKENREENYQDFHLLITSEKTYQNPTFWQEEYQKVYEI